MLSNFTAKYRKIESGYMGADRRMAGSSYRRKNDRRMQGNA